MTEMWSTMHYNAYYVDQNATAYSSRQSQRGVKNKSDSKGDKGGHKIALGIDPKHVHVRKLKQPVNSDPYNRCKRGKGYVVEIRRQKC